MTSHSGPFLKWAGGKTQLLAAILPRLPAQIRTYYEPFIGGGAVFFALAAERRFRRAVIADRNPALVEAYQTVRDHVEPLIEALAEHQGHARDADYFYALRGVDPARLDPVARTARLIFMNKTCFNGLYRVNRRGIFNVPFGKYANPRVLNEPSLRGASEALAHTEILEADFEQVARRPKSGDAIYFDPPYVPLSATSSFTAYDAHPFGPDDHLRLSEAYRACWRRGAVAVLSNSDCPATRKLYRGLELQTVEATRAINSVAASRGRVNEVLAVGLARTSSLPMQRDSALPAAARRIQSRRKIA